MRTKLLFSFLFTFVFSLLSSQVPQGFNYQAIARDISGNPITNHLLPVRISIQSDSLGGTTFWIEEHSSVTTNGFGLFTLILGQGIRQTASTVAAFNNIDWSVVPKFIKTEINYNGWQVMGSARLWSVPYSMMAGDLSGAVKKLAVTGETSNMEEALFEVKNKNGQTVFAVYNDGVRVYVNDGTVKGATKGGFAIGGFGTVKAPGQEYFRVTSDSTRIYVDDGIAKGAAKGGFAIGGFSTVKAPGQEYLRVTRDSTRIYLNNTVTKSAKGGFAIGGFNQAKGGVQDFLTISYDSIRMYINDNPVKSTKGGFAIGGFGTVKGPKRDYMTISPDSTNFYVRTLSPLVSSSFNIVGVDPYFTQKSLLKANTDTVSVSKVLALQKNLIVSGNLDVEGTFKQAPLVMTTAASSITQTTASGGGNIVSNSGAAVIQSGVCWSTSPNPTILLTTKTTDGLALGPYTSTITGLTASTLYYVRAYATNSIGTSYGNEISFTTIPVAPPIVTTTTASSITQTTASGGGNITSDGGVSVTARGVCWNTSSNPTTANNKTTDGSGTGIFTSSITGLTVSTTYYLRAYATNSVGTAYGDEISFTTLPIAPPIVTTTTASSITQTTASGGGNITSDGGASVTTRGVCWNISSNPTTANNKTTDGSGTGIFTSSMTGLTIATTYYIRAYATNSAGTAYGNELSFTTNSATLASVTTTAASSITQTTATSGGNITSNGGASVTALGVCWNTSTNPTTANSKTIDGTVTGIFTSSISGLTIGTTYYIRAYATNSAGTSYGNEISFTTSSAIVATLTTTAASSITQTTSSGGGNITSDGGASVTARGVCWNTSTNPTISNSKTTDGSGTGIFTSSITGLTASTTYYLRAYATNSAGTAYGNEISFTTNSATVASVTTTAASSITQTAAASGGNITSDGGASVTTRGVCWNTSSNPTTANNKTTDGSGTGIFTSSMTGLTSSTSYFVRAYATNSVGTAYGNEISFTTTSAIGSVTDIDGNTYITMNIGTQTWMAENLKTTSYNDGTAIPNVTVNAAWAALTTGAFSDYNNTPANSITYGRLYNWYAVDNNAATKVASNGGKNVCPTSWHVPTDNEWNTLTIYLGGEAVAGGKLKEAGLSHWFTPNTGATNETGFAALPGGYRTNGGTYGSIMVSGNWWNSTEYSTTVAWGRGMNYSDVIVNRTINNKLWGVSVRCVSDF